MVRNLVQVTVPSGSRADVRNHCFEKWRTTTMFDMKIFNLDTGSYLRMTPGKALEKADK